MEILENYIKQMVANKIIPGATYGIYQQGKWVNAQVGSSQLLPTALVLQENAIYDVASLTKVLVTTPLLLKLYEQKQIDILKPVHYYLPRFKYLEVTVKQLTTHQSGLAKNIPNYPIKTATDVENYMYDIPQDNTAGDTIHYSDANFLLLGAVIEAVTKQPIDRLFSEQITKPLAIENLLFNPKNKAKLECVPTELHTQRGLIKGDVHDHKAYCLGGIAAHAGLFANIEAIEKLINHLMGWNSPELLTDESRKLIQTVQGEDRVNKRSIGWDLRFNQAQQPIMYHTGFTGTFILINPMKTEAVIVLTNRIHPNRENQLFLTVRDKFIEAYCKR
ncbi:serine hydrolase domain-containing protein [Brochothrix thermosphacta]|uniref:serine hydrolase domain-containing protein n=1 Tax=Brochothrix thermosphacta TaxID=2756 RepID=UPI001C4EC8E1|nr:serine hydrolase domain-containing protein [Brochothrix thermosphacta]